MTDQLSPVVLRFLAWIRDNEHHESGWIEAVSTPPGEFAPHPDTWKHIRVSGERVSIKIHADVVSEVANYFDAVPHTEFCECRRMYRPNAAGLRALEEVGL